MLSHKTKYKHIPQRGFLKLPLAVEFVEQGLTW